MPTNQSDFFLIGDSNASVIARAANAQGYTFKGRAIGPGRIFDTDFFTVKGDRFVMTLPEKTNNVAPDSFFDLLEWKGPILSTVGFNSQLIGQTVARDMRIHGLDARNLSQAVLEALVGNWKAPALRFYSLLVERGCDIWFTHSPQRFPDLYFDVAIRLENILRQRLIDLGVSPVDVRAATTDSEGKLLEQLHSDLPRDQTHGNIEWGGLVFGDFARQAGLSA